MELHRIGKTTEFVDLKPIILDIRGTTIAVYRCNGKYHAYLNQCPHQAGPACEGKVVGNVDAEILSDGRVRESVSDKYKNIVCP